jgi:hypothetical protein
MPKVLNQELLIVIIFADDKSFVPADLGRRVLERNTAEGREREKRRDLSRPSST